VNSLQDLAGIKPASPERAARVPAGARLAIRNTYALSGNAQYYWDNISWAPTQTMNVHENTTQTKTGIYPNPFTDVIKFTESKNLKSVRIYSTSGQFITEIRNFENTISLKDLASGVYVARMEMKDGTSHTVKVIKK